MSKQSDQAFWKWYESASPPKAMSSIEAWRAALDWARPIVKEAIAKAKQSKKSKTDSVPYTGDFLEFWRAYPTGARGKSGKGTAFKVWKRMHLSSRWPDILNALTRAKRSEQWTRDDGQYIPNPATWLNRRGWEDELPEFKSGMEESSEHRKPGDMSQAEKELYGRFEEMDKVKNGVVSQAGR